MMENGNEQIIGLLSEIQRVTGFAAQYQGLADRGPILGSGVVPFCRQCVEHPVLGTLCRSTYCTAAMNALQSGEPYYQRCWAGLIFVAVPVVKQDACVGCISIGGFFFDGEQGEIQATVRQRVETLHRHDAETLLAVLKSLQAIAPVTLRGLGNYLLEATFSSGINRESFFVRQHEKYEQQRAIAEAVEDAKKGVGSDTDLMGDAYRLVAYLERRDKDATRRFFSGYLARLLVASNWNLQKLKAHLRVLLAVLTSREILRGADWTSATAREMRYLLRLEKAKSTEDSCYEVAEVIQKHFAAAGEDVRSVSAVDKGLQWMQTHFPEKISLAQLSRVSGASVSTLVKGIKKRTGKSCKQNLLEIRMAEARRLLATTNLDVSMITGMCGFYDQSHFTREFKGVTGLTPHRFRRMIIEDSIRPS